MGKGRPWFELRPNKQGPATIRVGFTYDGRQMYFSTGLKVEPADWDKENGRAYTTDGRKHYKPTNDLLAKIEGAVHTAYISLKVETSSIPSPAALIERIRVMVNGTASTGKAITITDLVLQVHQLKRETGKLKTKDNAYNRTAAMVARFCKEYRMPNDPALADQVFFDKWLAFLERDTGFHRNQVHKINKLLRAALRYADERSLVPGIHKAYQSRANSVGEILTHQIKLSAHEINKLADCDLAAFPTIQAARDWFIIGCMTGLRVSDYPKAHPDNVTNQYSAPLLQVKTQKTGKTIRVRVQPLLQAVWDRNGGTPPPLAEQTINRKLKEAAELAGLTHLVRDPDTGQTARVCDSISTHTARRSFATWAYLAGMPIIEIMRVTGHSKLETFMRYIRISEDEAAESIARMPVFTGMTIKMGA